MLWISLVWLKFGVVCSGLDLVMAYTCCVSAGLSHDLVSGFYPQVKGSLYHKDVFITNNIVELVDF